MNLAGAYDLHVHVDPDVVGRIVDDVTLAERFAARGLAGFALKSHYTSTAERARVVNRAVPGARVIGTITLNAAVGGLNPLAVEIAAREGARIVWLPTVDAVNEAGARDREYAHPPMWVRIERELREIGLEPPPVPVLDGDGAPLPALLDVLGVVARHQLALATGHLGRDEDLRGRRRGARARHPRRRRHAPRVPGRRIFRSRIRSRSRRAARCSSAASPRRTPESARGASRGGDPGPRAPSATCSRPTSRAAREPACRGRAAAVRATAARSRASARRRSGTITVVNSASLGGMKRPARHRRAPRPTSSGPAPAAPIAVCTRAGGDAQVIALSYGERGESGELWKQEGMTIDRVKRGAPRGGGEGRGGARRRVPPRWTSATTRSTSVRSALAAVVDAIREFDPDVLVTHTDTDPFNPDHPVAPPRRRPARGHWRPEWASRARSPSIKPAQAPPVPAPPAPSCATSRRPRSWTSRRSGSAKIEAMAAMEAQRYLQTYYAQRGEQRGNHARRATGHSEVRYAEAFQAGAAADGGRSCERSRRTVYEAAGRTGLIDST